MRVFILNTGYLETDRNCVVACGTIGTYSNPHIQNQWIQLPVMAFLIETGDGYILYDTGSNPAASVFATEFTKSPADMAQQSRMLLPDSHSR